MYDDGYEKQWAPHWRGRFGSSCLTSSGKSRSFPFTPWIATPDLIAEAREPPYRRPLDAGGPTEHPSVGNERVGRPDDRRIGALELHLHGAGTGVGDEPGERHEGGRGVGKGALRRERKGRAHHRAVGGAVDEVAERIQRGRGVGHRFDRGTAQNRLYIGSFGAMMVFELMRCLIASPWACVMRPFLTA